MAVKKTGKRKSPAKTAKLVKSAGSKKATGSKKSSRRSSSLSAKFEKTAVEVLAGAAAGAVRALIPPLEEAATATERRAGAKTPGKPKRRNSTR